MPLGIGGSPYYTPGGTPFGTGPGSAPVARSIWEQAPDVGYYAYGRSLGVPDDNSAFSQWFSKQFPQFQRGYGAYTAEHPFSANIVDYANSIGGYDDWLRRFNAQDPRLRGLDPSGRGAGPSRWIMR
jgi:hypothetical protein